MNISEMFDLETFNEYIATGYISERSHDTLPLSIYNYTANTQWEQKWDNITMHCRGLIVDDAGLVVGNCLKKFFNYNEPNAQALQTDGLVQVTDKLDGSYLSVCKYDGQLVVATRGSFNSEQAKEAQDIINENFQYKDHLLRACEGYTYIFEIIYPKNRIVLDYGSLRDIVLIGCLLNRENVDGQFWVPASRLYWPGESVKEFGHKTMAEALAMPPRDNTEGVVVYFVKTGERVKIKTEEYVRLHKLFTQYSIKTLLDLIVEKQDVSKYMSELPDELYAIVKKDYDMLWHRFYEIDESIHENFISIKHIKDRKEFARQAIQLEHSKMMFCLYDQQSQDRIADHIWKLIRVELKE